METSIELSDHIAYMSVTRFWYNHLTIDRLQTSRNTITNSKNNSIRLRIADKTYRISLHNRGYPIYRPDTLLKVLLEKYTKLQYYVHRHCDTIFIQCIEANIKLLSTRLATKIEAHQVRPDTFAINFRAFVSSMKYTIKLHCNGVCIATIPARFRKGKIVGDTIHYLSQGLVRPNDVIKANIIEHRANGAMFRCNEFELNIRLKYVLLTRYKQLTITDRDQDKAITIDYGVSKIRIWSIHSRISNIFGCIRVGIDNVTYIIPYKSESYDISYCTNILASSLRRIGIQALRYAKRIELRCSRRFIIYLDMHPSIYKIVSDASYLKYHVLEFQDKTSNKVELSFDGYTISSYRKGTLYVNGGPTWSSDDLPIITLEPGMGQLDIVFECI